MKGLNRIALAVMAASSVAAVPAAMASTDGPASVRMGVIEVTPTVKTTAGYDDNVYREGKNADKAVSEKGSKFLTIAPSVDFRAISGLNEYGITLDAKKVDFSSESAANYTDYGISADMTHEFTARNRIALDGEFAKKHDAGSYLSTTKREPYEYTLKRAAGVYGLGAKTATMHFDLFANYAAKDYEKAVDIKDNTSKEYGATAYYKVMPKTDLLLEAKKRNLDYDNARNSGYDITSYLVGASWEATAKTTGYAKFGRRTRSADAAGVKDENFNGWEVGISYLPMPYSLIQLSTTRDYGLETENTETNDFTKGTTTRLDWKHDWTPLLTSRFYGSYTSQDVVNSGGKTQKDRTIKGYGLGMDYKVARWVTVSLDYNHTKRDEKVKVGTKDNYSRNVYMLSASFSL